MTDYNEQNPRPYRKGLDRKTPEESFKLKSKDFTEEELITLVRGSQEGFIKPGYKPAARQIFFHNKSLKMPKRDVIFYWRSLYVLCHDEYEFAIKAVGDWDLYESIKRNCKVLASTYIPLWEEEREKRLLSKAYGNVLEDIKGGDVKSSQWMIQHLTKFKGKPTKEERAKTKDKVEATLGPIDSVLDDIETNYSKLN